MANEDEVKRKPYVYFGNHPLNTIEERIVMRVLRTISPQITKASMAEAAREVKLLLDALVAPEPIPPSNPYVTTANPTQWIGMG